MNDIDPRFTSPDEKRDYWPIVRLVLVAAIVVLGGRWVLRNYPVPFLDQSAYIEKTQRENDRVLTFFIEALAEHREESGNYPLGLVDLLRPTRVPRGIARGIPPRDAWDHPLRYFSDGEIFLLVSVGRDGEPETEDYHLLRAERRRDTVCDNPDADLVVSDRGWHQRCDPDRSAQQHQSGSIDGDPLEGSTEGIRYNRLARGERVHADRATTQGRHPDCRPQRPARPG